MIKYNIEGNINFYDELFKSLDDDSDDEDNEMICQITGSALSNKFVTLECKHKFNYNALYTEICRQKYVFKTYDFNTMSKNDKQKVRDSKLDYFIRCPYCRNIQFTIMPYYEDLVIEKKYGINSLDLDALGPPTSKYDEPYDNNYTFIWYGVPFTKGKCSKALCVHKYVSPIPDTKLYCKVHYKSAVKAYHSYLKQKELDEKKKLKEDILLQRQTLFDAKNAERLAKGLAPLKRLPSIKTKVKPISENTVLPAEPIGQYVDLDLDVDNNKSELINDVKSDIKNGCKTILKYGANKGKMCGGKIVNDTGCCFRHCKL